MTKMANNPFREEDIIKKIKEGTPFLMAVSLFNKKEKKGKELSSFIIANNFPNNKIDGAKRAVVKLMGDAKKEK